LEEAGLGKLPVLKAAVLTIQIFRMLQSKAGIANKDYLAQKSQLETGQRGDYT
jgi:hypothetical protein